MPKFDPPEIESSPLEKLYLTIKHICAKLNSSVGPTSFKESESSTRGGSGQGVKPALQLTPSEMLRLTVQVRHCRLSQS